MLEERQLSALSGAAQYDWASGFGRDISIQEEVAWYFPDDAMNRLHPTKPVKNFEV
jgi:hypothetical protein